MADRAPTRGVETTVIPGFLPLFPYLLGAVRSTLSPPFAWHRVAIGDTNAARYSLWRILRLCLAHNGSCFERNFAGAAVALPCDTVAVRQRVEFFPQQKALELADKSSYRLLIALEKVFSN
jgi:hypothetical protein